jgi:hypothetical protein
MTYSHRLAITVMLWTAECDGLLQASLSAGRLAVARLPIASCKIAFEPVASSTSNLGRKFYQMSSIST